MNALLGLRVPHFRRAFLAGSTVTLAQWVVNTVLVAHAFAVSQSAPLVGVIVLAQFGPTLLLGLPMGVVADRKSRRSLMMVGVSIQVASAACAAALAAWSVAPTILVIPAVTFGIGQAVYLPAFAASLPTLLPESKLATAVALNSWQLSVGRVAGPPLGALVYATAGPVTALSLGLVLGCTGLALFGSVRPPSANTSTEPLLTAMFGGFAVARRDAVVRQSLIAIAIFSVCCMPIASHMPELAATIGIGTDDPAYSIVLGAFGLGTLTGGFAVTTITRVGNVRIIARTSLLVFGLLLLALSLSTTLGSVSVWLIGVGVAYFVTFTALSVRLQSRLTLEVRGRVMAMWVVSFGGMLPVGAALAGPLIESISLAVVLQFGAVIAVALGLLATRTTRMENRAT